MKYEHVYEINHQKILDSLAKCKPEENTWWTNGSIWFYNVCQRRNAGGKSAVCNKLLVKLCPLYRPQNSKFLQYFDEQIRSKIVEKGKLSGKRKEYTETKRDASRSRWPCGLRRGSAAAWLLWSRVWIPLRARMSVPRVCYVMCR
jgi:hypothetical protein